MKTIKSFTCRWVRVTSNVTIDSPSKEYIPTLLLLLNPNYLLMHTLSSIKSAVKGGVSAIKKSNFNCLINFVLLEFHCVLSRRVWDILSLLPTNPALLRGFQTLETPLSELLDPSSPQKLMYSLYIVESLSLKSTGMKCSSDDKADQPWSRFFIVQGGLRHLFDIFMSGEN